MITMWNILHKKHVLAILAFNIFFFAYSLFGLSSTAQALKRGNYDIVYFWDSSLQPVLDYQEKLASVLGPRIAEKLKIVGRGDKYGVVYKRNGTFFSSANIAARHNKILAQVEMSAGQVIANRNFFDLYNVSYGLGDNLSWLKRQYGIVFRYLGQDVGKNLFIEKTAYNNYILVYQRLGKKESTQKIAARHAKLLKRKGLTASIAPAQNNKIVFGESNFLQINDRSPPKSQSKVFRTSKNRQKPSQKKNAQIKPVEQVSKGTVLERSIEQYIKILRRRKKISSDEQTAWLIYDITNNRTLVDINIDKSLQAASMIKPFVALAFFIKVKDGELIYGPRSRRKMEAMIQHSDNKATNWLMRYIGGPEAVEKTLKGYSREIFKRTKILEYIPANGRTYRNRAAPRDYGNFLDALWNHKLIYGKEIRRLMALPNRDRIYQGTSIPHGTLVLDKTGTTARLCGDMGILAPKSKNGRRYPYIFVGIIEKKRRTRDYGSWMSKRGNVIRKVSDLVYNKLKKEHRLL